MNEQEIKTVLAKTHERKGYKGIFYLMLFIWREHRRNKKQKTLAKFTIVLPADSF